MMQLGIFAKTFPRPTLDAVLESVRSAGFYCVQFNFSCAGLPSLPGRLKPGGLQAIAQAHKRLGIRMAAVSGTTNLIDPDRSQRAAGLRKLDELTASCQELGTGVMTLCSGTRDRTDMWRGHPDNASADAWRDLIASLEALLPRAEACGVVLAIEPEQGNVVNSVSKARRLLDELRSPALGILLDAANLLSPEAFDQQQRILSEAIEQLGARIVLAHAKDATRAGTVCPLGQGDLDWELYIGLLERSGYGGPIIMHGIEEAAVGESRDHLLGIMNLGLGRAGHAGRQEQ